MTQNVYELRVERLRFWIEQDSEGNIADFCRSLDLPASRASYISQLLGGHRKIGERAARALEAAGHKPTGWLDAGMDGATEPPMLDNPLHVNMQLIAMLPKMERERIREHIEFVLHQYEKKRRLSGQTQNIVTRDRIPPVTSVTQREVAARTAAAGAARRKVGSRSLNVSETSTQRKRRQSV